MVAAVFDGKNQIQQGRQQSPRRVEYHYKLDFTPTGGILAAGLAATQDLEIGILPAGYVHERLDAVLRVAEGEASTMHVGIETDDDAFGVSLNLNGAVNAKVGVGAPAFVAGEYLHANTPVRVKCPAAANTINVAKVDLVFIGYMRDTNLER